MTAWYNEIDSHAAQWLRNLIQENLIAPGVVDERPIQSVRPYELQQFTQCHFFAGIGGWSLALRLANWPDRRPVWTGSCPCQPFSLAGKRGGFADERHLWPYWRYLIAVRRPATVLGEQVASAGEWLRLVRGDLEALDYPVGAIPVEAASTGADHLRDRYWFVAERSQQQQRDGTGDARSARGDEYPDGGSECVALGDARGARLAFGSFAENQRGDVRHERTPVASPGFGGFALAHSYVNGSGDGRLQRSGQLGRIGCNPQTRDGGALSESFGGVLDGRTDFPQRGSQERVVDRIGGEYEWVLGADGKARRVKPGIRLLAHAVSGRVAVLRTVQRPNVAEETEEHWYSRIKALKGFGNAIDPICAATFVKAVMECEP